MAIDGCDDYPKKGTAEFAKAVEYVARVAWRRMMRVKPDFETALQNAILTGLADEDIAAAYIASQGAALRNEREREFHRAVYLQVIAEQRRRVTA